MNAHSVQYMNLTIIELKKILGGGVWVSHILIIFDLNIPQSQFIPFAKINTVLSLYHRIPYPIHFPPLILYAINFLPDPVSSKPLVL